MVCANSDTAMCTKIFSSSRFKRVVFHLPFDHLPPHILYHLPHNFLYHLPHHFEKLKYAYIVVAFMVADMKVDMVADMGVDKVADKVAETF